VLALNKKIVGGALPRGRKITRPKKVGGNGDRTHGGWSGGRGGLVFSISNVRRGGGKGKELSIIYLRYQLFGGGCETRGKTKKSGV